MNLSADLLEPTTHVGGSDVNKSTNMAQDFSLNKIYQDCTASFEALMR